MTWSAANTWATTLVYGGVSGWRLPTTVDGVFDFGSDGTTTAGYNITTSEMGHLFYTELGNKGYWATDGTFPQPDYGLLNTGPFLNMEVFAYWSGTEYANPPPGYAWYFLFNDGGQAVHPKTAVDPQTDKFYAWAVHSGDVGPAAVPEPGTALLLGSGLVGLVSIGLRRAKRRRD